MGPRGEEAGRATGWKVQPSQALPPSIPSSSQVSRPIAHSEGSGVSAPGPSQHLAVTYLFHYSIVHDWFFLVAVTKDLTRIT